MNPNTGHIVSLGHVPEVDKESLMKALQAQGYEPVPDELSKAAEMKLSGKSEAYVSLTSGGKLSNWAKDKRKKKHKKKIANVSKKRNRLK